MDCQCRFLEPNSCFIHISTQNGVQASATHADGTNTLESGCATFALLLLAATNAAQAISPPAARFTALLLMSASMQCSQPALASLPKLPQLPPRSKASCPPLSRPRYLGPSAALWSLAPLHNCRSSLRRLVSRSFASAPDAAAQVASVAASAPSCRLPPQSLLPPSGPSSPNCLSSLSCQLCFYF